MRFWWWNPYFCLYENIIILSIEKYLHHSAHSLILYHWLLDFVFADGKSAVNQIATSLKVICLFFPAPFKSSLCIWSLKLYYDVSIVSFKCYATWNLSGLLKYVDFCLYQFWEVLSHHPFKYCLFSSLFTHFSRNLIRCMRECLTLSSVFKSLSYFLAFLGCIFSLNIFSSIFHSLVLLQAGFNLLFNLFVKYLISALFSNYRSSIWLFYDVLGLYPF